MRSGTKEMTRSNEGTKILCPNKWIFVTLGAGIAECYFCLKKYGKMPQLEIFLSIRWMNVKTLTCKSKPANHISGCEDSLMAKMPDIHCRSLVSLIDPF